MSQLFSREDRRWLRPGKYPHPRASYRQHSHAEYMSLPTHSPCVPLTGRGDSEGGEEEGWHLAGGGIKLAFCACANGEREYFSRRHAGLQKSKNYADFKSSLLIPVPWEPCAKCFTTASSYTLQEAISFCFCFLNVFIDLTEGRRGRKR